MTRSALPWLVTTGLPRRGPGSRDREGRADERAPERRTAVVSRRAAESASAPAADQVLE
ncbi:MAG TPA: hypothetical protein VGS06_26810 [Streptosporangiaceae bacterium]|nr:hypothetical protein [Streptosporangiaceae bacterium]